MAPRSGSPAHLPAAGRSRATYAVLLLVTVALGLASRRLPGAFPPLLARYAGDVLWASMVFWVIALLRPGAATLRVAVAAILIAFSIELSQLYHAPWLDAVRASTIGALVLGQGFLGSDLVCYAVGVTIAALIDWFAHGRDRLPDRPSPRQGAEG